MSKPRAYSDERTSKGKLVSTGAGPAESPPLGARGHSEQPTNDDGSTFKRRKVPYPKKNLGLRKNVSSNRSIEM